MSRVDQRKLLERLHPKYLRRWDFEEEISMDACDYDLVGFGKI